MLCTAAVAIGRWASPADPFGLHAAFPWLWIIPALLAMRYGTAIGVTAVVTLVVCWIVLPQLDAALATEDALFPRVFFLGGVILTLICAQFSDIWSARTRRLRAANAYLDERLNTLTKNHFLLRLSHERLEQDLLAKPLTLRETLSRLRALTDGGNRVDEGGLRGAGEFLQLLGQSCQLEIASLHAMAADGSHAVQPAATLGQVQALDPSDPLLRYAVARGRMAHVQSAQLSEADRSESRYLICAPLIPSDGLPGGMLVVEKLPFFALNTDTLQLLSVLIGYYTDGLSLDQVTHRIRNVLPDCPLALALDLIRLHRIRLEAGIASSIVALVFATDENARDLFEQVKRLKRTVDLTWEITQANHSALITLLPLAGTAAVDGYLLRIESALKNQFGTGFLENNVVIHTARVGLASPEDTLSSLVRRCAL